MFSQWIKFLSIYELKKMLESFKKKEVEFDSKVNLMDERNNSDGESKNRKSFGHIQVQRTRKESDLLQL